MAIKILIVDDDPVSRALLEDHVANFGHDVFVAESATRAMYTLERTPVHLVMADWLMPDVTGLDLCRWVRGRTLPRSPHFVMITAVSDKDRMVEAFEAGADDFVVKPFDEMELIARFRAWTRLINLQDQLAAKHEEAVRFSSKLLELNNKLAAMGTPSERRAG